MLRWIAVALAFRVLSDCPCGYEQVPVGAGKAVVRFPTPSPYGGADLTIFPVPHTLAAHSMLISTHTLPVKSLI